MFLAHQSLVCLPVTRACTVLPRAALPARPHPLVGSPACILRAHLVPFPGLRIPLPGHTVKASLGRPLVSTSWVHRWASQNYPVPTPGLDPVTAAVPLVSRAHPGRAGFGQGAQPLSICPQSCTSTDGPCSLGSWAPPCSPGVPDGVHTGPATSAGHSTTLYVHPG